MTLKPPATVDIATIASAKRRARKPRKPSVKLVTKLDLLKQKFGSHSAFERIRRAVKAGRTELDLYRPTGSAKANQTTDGLLELMRLSGLHITPHPTGTPLCVKFVITNLGAL